MDLIPAIPLPEQFTNADPVVKAVMIVLVLASLGCWTIILEKLVVLARLGRAAARFEAWSRGLARLGTSGAASRVSSAATAASADADVSESRAERRARIERETRRAIAEELSGAEWGLSYLATTGSAAPFIGLFGTVWGIMRSFASIAQSQDTSLAVVAPGIAEALAATALGLVAAIPAVIAYNRFATSLGRTAKRFNASAARAAETMSQPSSGDQR